MYLRFVAGAATENPYDLVGPFGTTSDLSLRTYLEPYETAWLDELLDWFNENLPVPPFRENREANRWSCDAVSWF
jgi:hypothetical protein